MALMHAMTDRCAERGHPEVRVVYDTNLLSPEDIHLLLDPVEEAVLGGGRLTVGERFQLGWMNLQVGRAGTDTLSLLEPDMIHTPVHWVDSVTHSLIHLRVQEGVCASLEGFGGPVFPRHENTCSICDHLGHNDGFLISRGDPAGEDSGWRMVCSREVHGEADDHSLRRVSLYEAVVGFEPRILPFLALPPGIVVDLARAQPAVTFGGRPVTILPGSSLARSYGLDSSGGR